MTIERNMFLSLWIAFVPVVGIACGGGNDGGAAGGAALSSPNAGAYAPATPAAPPANAPTAGTGTGTGAGTDLTVDGVTFSHPPVTIDTKDCLAHGDAPSVSIPADKVAEAAINALLKPIASPCEGDNQNFKWSSTAVIGQGLLSIAVEIEDHFDSPPGEPETGHFTASVQTFNFDLKNGAKRLALPDIVTQAGSDKQLAACFTEATGGEAGGTPTDDGSSAALNCKTAVANTMTDNDGHPIPTDWVATAQGLRLWSLLDHHSGDIQSSLVAWKDLVSDGLKPSVVLDFAKAQK